MRLDLNQRLSRY
ncbi:hypothetical protein D046_7134A, partial [Vibrio parahaemolyticus V-223/04]